MLYLVGQIEGAAEAIKSASAEGWVVVLLVVIVLSIVGTFGWILKRQMTDATDRELRFVAENRETIVYIRTTLTDTLRENTEAIQRMNDVISKCGGRTA